MDTESLARELRDANRRAAAAARARRRHARHGGSGHTLESLVPCGCVTELALAYWLAEEKSPRAGLEDRELERLPAALPPVVDAHVHVFPDRVFTALWAWFERYAWPVRYKLSAPEVASFLFARGVSRVVALHYAHKAGMSRGLNAFVAELARSDPRIVPLGTVLPGDPDALATLEEIAALGFVGVKLHCHVQGFAIDSTPAREILAACARLGLVVVAHAGREPKSPAYPRDPWELCAAERVARVLVDYPGLRLCVPHLGADEYVAYARLLERHDNLWLDTTMTLAGFFDDDAPLALLTQRPERVLYGTDFPNLPYAWARELTRVLALGLPESTLATLLGGTAEALFVRPQNSTSSASPSGVEDSTGRPRCERSG